MGTKVISNPNSRVTRQKVPAEHVLDSAENALNDVKDTYEGLLKPTNTDYLAARLHDACRDILEALRQLQK